MSQVCHVYLKDKREQPLFAEMRCRFSFMLSSAYVLNKFVSVDSVNVGLTGLIFLILDLNIAVTITMET